MQLLDVIARPRPVGSTTNHEITEYIGTYLESIGYAVDRKPFSCKRWEVGASHLTISDKKVSVQVSPYSKAFSGKREVVIVSNIKDLENTECEDKILVLKGELTMEQLQPKDYPFYYPDEHKALIECLENKKPCAIITVTGRSQMSGLEPFPMIEDGNFLIPVCSISNATFSDIEKELWDKEVELSIISSNQTVTAHQIIASKYVKDAKGTIVICAHMDSKYNTSGALDNASGVVTMLLAAGGIETDRYNIDIIPFNSEEYYDPQGEMIYLEEMNEKSKDIVLLINIDTLAYIGSKVAVALFNFDDKEQKQFNDTMKDFANIVPGEPWYAGDHAAFAFSGIKCVLVSASDLFGECISNTHCPKDTVSLIDESLIESAANYVCKIVNTF
ncbi:MAG: M28 family peptidase [Acutalibacteraceae bacterium]